MKEILLPDDVYKHPDRDYTWELDDMQIEDKIKELRKQIYHLQNCRKKQPKIAVFRKEKYGEGDMRVHTFRGWKIMDEEKRLFCADHWYPIQENEAIQLKKKYNLSDDALKVIDETLKHNK